MKFKALFAGVLMGAIALSSCVKNYESPEVTALRNARADEIRALAEYHRAEAAAATTLANAQAALDQAQAAYIAAQTQTEQANAASAMAQAEIDLQRAQYAKELAELRYQIQLLQLQQELAAAIVQGQIEANDNLLEVLAQYNIARSDLVDLVAELEDDEFMLAFLKEIVESVDPTVYIEELNKKAQENIAKKEAAIARVQKELDAINAYRTFTPDQLKDKELAARLALIDANTKFEQATENEDKAWDAFDESWDAIMETTVYYELYNQQVSWVSSELRSFLNKYSTGVDYQYNTETGAVEYYVVNSESKKVVIYNSASWEYADAELYPEAKDGIYEGDVSAWINPSWTYFAPGIDAANLEAMYNEWRKPLAKAVEDAKAEDPVDETKVENAQKALDAIDDDYAKVTAVLTEMAAVKPAFDATVKKAEDTYLEYVKREKAYYDAWQVKIDAQAEYDAIQNLLYYVDEYGNPVQVEAKIAELEDEIEDLQEDIFEIQAELMEDTIDVQQMVQRMKARIARMETEVAELKDEVAIQQKVVADLKAQLEAMLNGINGGAA
jgi:multidrug efflux pump subunit AcrA (membrane-fusion protein)